MSKWGLFFSLYFDRKYTPTTALLQTPKGVASSPWDSVDTMSERLFTFQVVYISSCLHFFYGHSKKTYAELAALNRIRMMITSWDAIDNLPLVAAMGVPSSKTNAKFIQTVSVCKFQRVHHNLVRGSESDLVCL